jgi:hypothetical protein
MVATARQAPEGGIGPIQLPSNGPARAALGSSGSMANANPASARAKGFSRDALDCGIGSIINIHPELRR